MKHKIRYWDKNTGRYVYDSFPQDGSFEICMGKPDKTGKEIWEGDIIWTTPAEKLSLGYGGPVLFGEHKRIADTVCGTDGGDEHEIEVTCYGFYCADGTLMTYFFNDLSDLYVVGNIHSNEIKI